VSRGHAIFISKLKKEVKRLEDKVEHYESLLYSHDICLKCGSPKDGQMCCLAEEE
jgi:hypothetical protein